MGSKKVIAICQSGGEFVTNRDGSLSYSGGEAYALDLDGETVLADFKSEVAETFSCSAEAVTLKYLLPSNNRTLITISKDKDLHRMLTFLGDSTTAELFLVSDHHQPPLSNALAPASRSSRTTVSEAAVVPVVAVGDHAPIDSLEPPLPAAAAAPLRAVGLPCRAAQQWENTITGVDQRFGSFGEFREALHKFSIAHGFAYRYKKNDSHRVTVKCKAPGCPWRVYASRLSTTQLVCIKRMHPSHTCRDSAAAVVVKPGYRATRGWVGSIIKEKLKVSPNYKPKDIAEDISREYGIRLNYSQAWRAKEIAREQLQGSFKRAYTLLPSFCHRIAETNPGSVAVFATKEDSSFHRLFVAFRASLAGFRLACRPLLFLDSAPLNSKYQGVLLAAVAADGDDGVFPVAFAVVDADSDENWRWFLAELRAAGVEPPPPAAAAVTFVTDLNEGLREMLPEVFENCRHGLCLRHLAEKLNRDLKGQFSHEARRFMVNDLYAAAYAPKLEDLERNLESIKGISPDAYEWVASTEARRWANALFEGARYNLATSTFGREFYGWVSEAHELPITQMMDALRGRIMQDMYARRAEAAQWATKLTPSKEDRLEKTALAAQSLQVVILHDETFEVRGGGSELEKVDLGRWDCSCREWHITGLPCRHAVAVMECTGRSPYDYCSPYFTADNYRLAYAESIQPIPDVDGPGEAAGASAAAAAVEVMVTPPPTKRPPGRPKTPKAESIDVIKRQLQCSKCKGLGHNKKTCKVLALTSS